MKEYTKKQYVKELMAKRKSSKNRAGYILGVVLFSTVIAGAILFPLVKLNIINTSPEAQEYLLKTVFYNFSASDLMQILLRTTGTASSLQILLFIYWGYYLFLVFPSALIIWDTFGGIKFKPHEKGLIAIQQIRDIIQDTPKTLTIEQKFQIRRAIRFGSFYKNIVPLPKGWLKKAEYQWFAHVINTREIKTITYTLSKIESVFLGTTANFPKDLSPLLVSLDTLEYFYFLLATRVERENFRVIDLTKSKETEFDILFNFANQIRPLILYAKNQKKPTKKEGLRQFVSNFAISVWQNEIVRQAGNISGVAAFIMAIGVLIFKIDITQAFLTWFTITFGSLSISVGISKKNKSKQQSEST